MAEQEQEIPGILILTHGLFGQELIKSAEMIIGSQMHVTAISLLPGMDLTEFMTAVKAALEILPEESLILCDLFGGTPANVAAAVKIEYSVQAVAGVNLSMLIEACCQRLSLRGSSLTEAVTAAGSNGCRCLEIISAEEEENII